MSRWGDRRSALYLSPDQLRLVELAEAWAEALEAVQDPELRDWLHDAMQPSLAAAFSDIPLH